MHDYADTASRLRGAGYFLGVSKLRLITSLTSLNFLVTSSS